MARKLLHFKVMISRASLYKLFIPALLLVGSCNAQITNIGERGETTQALCTQEKYIYLNRWGGTYRPGVSDSRANTSKRLDEEKDINPIAFEDEDWDLIKGCVEGVYSEFGFEVTDRTPAGNANHLEVVFTRDESKGVLGFANARSIGGEEFSCDINPNMLSWVFAYESKGALDYCHRATSAIALSLTLDLTESCGDVTSSTTTCDVDDANLLALTNQARNCEKGDCRCDQGTTSQNAFQRVSEVIVSDEFCVEE